MTYEERYAATVAALLATDHWRRQYDRNPELRAAWDDPYTDYGNVDITVTDPMQVGRDDLMLLVMIENPDVELARAWQKILEAQGTMPLRDAIEKFGIRGHPDFGAHFPVTPPPHGDAAWATQELKRRQEETIETARIRAAGRAKRDRSN